MANILQAQCEEYLLFYEYMQGNDFGGLLYDDVLVESIDFCDDGYVVYVEEVSSSMSFSSSLVPSHEPYCHIDDGFYIDTQFGPTVRAYQSALTVLHTCKVVPIDYCFMSVEILHGVEIYYDELSSEFHLSEFSAPTNYVLESLYDSYAIVLEPYDLRTDVTVSYGIDVNDLLNFMHDITQEYYFNCLSDDVLGMTLFSSFGYNMFVHSQFRADSFSRNVIGKVAEDYILFDDDNAELNWSGQCIARDTITMYDTSSMYRGYDFVVGSGLDIVEAVDTFYYMVHVVSDDVGLGDTAISPTQRYQMISENLTAACVSVIEACFIEAVGSEIIINESTGFAKIGYESVSDEANIVEVSSVA